MADTEKPEPLKTREAFEWLGQALFTGGAEVIKTLPGIEGSAELKAAIAVVLPTFGRAIGRGAFNAVTSRRDLTLTGFVAGVGGPEEAKAQAQAKANDPDYHEVMFRTFRAMLDAADPSVVETLGFMAGKYTYANQKPDNYFRALGRLLCDMDAGELDDLRRLLRGVSECEGKVNAAEIDLAVNREPDNGSIKYFAEANLRNGGPRHPIRQVDAVQRLFMLLKREGFGSVGHVGGIGDAGTVEGRITLSFETVRRLLDTIAPSRA